MRVDDRELMQALLDSPSRHAIVVTDPKGNITLWNRGAERIFGYSREEIVGESAEKLFVANDRKNHVPDKEMRQARREGCAEDFRWHIRKDGSTFWGDGMMYPVRVHGRDRPEAPSRRAPAARLRRCAHWPAEPRRTLSTSRGHDRIRTAAR
jgi:PAS domain S-box-containing protein